MNLRFEQPELLMLGVLAVPLAILGLRAMAGMDAVRKWAAVGLRVALLLLVVVVLAGPHSLREHNHMTVIAVVDISGSIRRFADLPPVDETGRQDTIASLRKWVREATSEGRRPGDRVGLVAFDGQAIAISSPTAGDYIDDNLDLPTVDGTNIAEAIRLATAMMPGDTGRRIVLITDGNETIGSAIDAVREAAAGGRTDATARTTSTTIDVVPIEYRVQGDVQVARVEAPPAARPGQTVTVRMVIESTNAATGRLTLRREGIPVDLDPASPGHSRRVSLPAGQSVFLAHVELGETPINRFEAIFEPDDPSMDALPDNNRAEAFTATPSRGSALVLSSAPVSAAASSHALASMLDRAGIPVSVQPPAFLPDDLLSLQNHDLIVLDNVAAYELTDIQQAMLVRYVNQLGGGLMMIGGENGFGAGGWIGSPVAEIMPVQLDPPRELRSPIAGLVIVMDRSGSMNRPVGGARATQQEVANEAAALAVETIQAEAYIGVVAFDHTPEEYVPLQLNDNPAEIASRIRQIRANGGTRIEPALRLAYAMLRDAPVQRRYIVLLTDGISQDPDMASFIAMMRDQDVQITTIGVGDEIDIEQLQMIADGTGGVFHHVRNPRVLPRVMVDSVREFNKPLLKESPFHPVLLPTGSTLTVGMEDSPTLGGLVITAPRDDPRAAIEMTHPDGEPLLAHWQVGLGRVAAFTSDLDGRWSRDWEGWGGAQAFWTQLVRTIARPAVSSETELLTFIRDDELRIVLEGSGEQDGFLDYVQVEGAVYTPDGREVRVRLRQTAPGRFEGSIPATHAGNYIVALNPRQGNRSLAPVIGGVSRATGEEFRRYTANIALLEEILAIGGGRRLDITAPRDAKLFDRSAIAPSRSMLPAWRAMVPWIIALLLLDVACRRLAWDWPMIANAMLAAIRKVTPARIRGQAAVATLGGLRTASERIEQRRQRSKEGIEEFEATGVVAPPPPRSAFAKPSLKPNTSAVPPKREPTQADAARVSDALDALLGRTTDTDRPATGAPAKNKAATQDGSAEKPDDGSSTRSKLFDAKRRAREKLDE
ncbi:MAG TPA: VWA domain-containing protein [Phycisphaerales bacterium]|nr:VWA domain-containing protein [Phycisphaerales bacterium]